jgi:hypothetical protein
VAYTTDQIRQMIIAESRRQGVDPRLSLAVSTQESYLNPNAVGDNGRSLGLFQLQPAAAIDAGIDPKRRGEVELNIPGGITYLKQKLQQSGGNVEQALSRYNRGTPTYRGIGDPRYVENVLGHYQKQPPSLLARIGRALSPASAEAAQRTVPAAPPEDVDALLQQIQARRQQLQQPSTPAPAASAAPAGPVPQQGAGPPVPGSAAPQPAASAPQPEDVDTLLQQIQARRQQLQQQNAPAPVAAPAVQGPPTAATQVGSPAAPAPAPAAAPPAAPPFDHRAFAAQELARLQQDEQQRLGNWRIPAATGISAGSAMLGTAAGTLVAPLTGPLAPVMPLVGEMAGSYLGRQANIALGLEEGQPWAMGPSDIAAVGAPALSRGRQVVQDLRAGVRPTTVPTVAAERVAAAGEAQVPLTYGEAIESPTVKGVETALEKVPLVGTMGFRSRQQDAVKAAAQRQLQAQQEVMQQTPWKGLGQVQAAAQGGSKQAQNVLDEIAQSGDDWTKITQAGGNLNAFRSQQVANRLYGRVEQIAAGLGDVPLSKTQTVLDDTIRDLQNAVVPDTATIRYLEQIKTGLPGKTSYGQLRGLRSDLRDTMDDYYKGSNAVVGAKGVGALAKVKTALEQDLDSFALQGPNPELKAAAKQADTWYRQKVVPYEDTQLANALKSATPDEIYGKFIQRGHRDRAQKFYNALHPKGQEAVKVGMIAEAQQKALDPTTGVFSPKKFATSLETIQDAYGVFFKGEDKWKVDGLLKVMRAAERAGQFAENPPTGQRLIPYLIGGGLATGATMAPGAMAGTAAATKGLSWLLTSKTGTKILLNAHRAGETTFAMDNVLRELTTQGARVLGTELGEGLTEGTQVQVEPGRVTR